MRFSTLWAPTLKEDPKDAEIASHKLMLRSGMIRKIAAGIYALLPLGIKCHHKVAQIVREEMCRSGAQEVHLPSIIPAELWEKSGRWDVYGKELLRMQDRADRSFCYGPTHEEVITELVGNSVKSYKKLPLNVFQIQTKFRDEIRPRFGLMRCREFSMKDAYSFHADEACLDKTYRTMSDAYHRIFERCGLKFREVHADSGLIGGDKSAEFMVMSETGEDEVLIAGDSEYACNVEAAETTPYTQLDAPLPNNAPTLSLVETPGMKTITEVSTFLKVSPEQCLKTLLFQIDGTDELVMVLLRGDHEVNEYKVKKHLSCHTLELVDPQVSEEACGAKPGFLGPLNLKKQVRMIADHSLCLQTPYVVGANKDAYHYEGFVFQRELPHLETLVDIRVAIPGDTCPNSDSETYASSRGIEVGHIFKLGDKYSKDMSLLFSNEEGRPTPYQMGCYGIGIGRTLAAAIEQSHDEKGIVWPLALAPFEVDLIIVNMKDPLLVSTAEALYTQLIGKGIDVLIDDRQESIGKKFKDADLIGFPFQLVVGKSFINHQLLELKHRKTGESEELTVESCINRLCELLSHGS